MNKDEARTRLTEIGIIPVVRASSVEEARFAVGAVADGGISVVEITMAVPGALDAIRELVRTLPDVLVGAGSVLDEEMGRRCLDAGAEFLVTTGVRLDVLDLGLKENKFAMAGALTPTEVLTAWNAGSDFVKIFPCAQVGGPSYIKALRGPFPDIPLVPTGGVNLQTASEFIQVGSAALGVGAELVLKPALKSRAHEVIRDMARRFVEVVTEARSWMTPVKEAAIHARRAS
ncbi:MAG TPA: bifunctional 4-hydroxy-2-oxoglutarate aldolase/2-dehydro-3-deoxy-phosphogluconate aldolase [Terriglobia bacterium]